jgi:cobalt-zinc-cadmium efflux system outer membrane protein
MMSSVRLAILLAACLAGLAPARAQERAAPPEVVDLPAVLRLAREASPRLAVERQAVAGAEAGRIAAEAYPNPTLSFGQFRPSGGQSGTLFDGNRQSQANLEVPVLIAGQRGARIERADLEIEAARARVASGASSLGAEAGAAYVALLAAQEKVALLSAANEELVRLRNIVAGREASGMASRYDVARLDVELGGARARLADAKAEVSDRAGNLAALLGLRDWWPRASGSLNALDLGADALAKPRDRATTSPATVAAAREESAAKSAIEVARRERWPTPSVIAGRTWTNDPYGGANYLGLSVEIPILDTRRGPLAKAEADAITATLRRELAQAEVGANLERLANVIAARQSALQRFDQEAAVRLPALQQMAEDAYRLGRGSILELLDSTRSRYELQQARIELMAALYAAQLRYLATSGDLDARFGIEPPGTTPGR